MEFLQCDPRERKLKLAFARTVSKRYREENNAVMMMQSNNVYLTRGELPAMIEWYRLRFRKTAYIICSL